MWTDRFVKFAGQWWLVTEQCPTGLALACERDGRRIFAFWSAVRTIEALHTAPSWSEWAAFS